MKQTLEIDKIRQTIAALGAQYGAERIYLFGSYARGEAKANSDVDLRIDKGRIYGLFALAGFKLAIEEQLNTKVDLLTTESLDKQFLDSIHPEEILLYGKQ